MLDVIPPDSVVSLADGVVGGVLQVGIGPNNHVRYEVAYWANGVRVVQWLEAPEVAADSGTLPLSVALTSPGEAARQKELTALRKQAAELIERIEQLRDRDEGTAAR